MTRRLSYPAQIAAVAAAYFGAAKLGLLAAVAEKVVSSAWPPTGFALAALLLLGLRAWPGIALGAFLLNWTAGVPAAGAVGIAAGNTLEAVTAALLLTRVAHFRPSLERLRDVLALVTLAALASTTVSATIGVTSLWASGAIDRGAAQYLWFVWWSGDALGDLLVAPLVLTWADAVRRRREGEGEGGGEGEGEGKRGRPRARSLEAAGLLASLVAATYVLFQPPAGDEYAIFPIIMWAAVRFGALGSATASGVVSALAIWYTVHGRGSFVDATPVHNLLLLQMYLGLLAVTGLILAAITTERAEAARAARESEQRYRTLLDYAPEAILVHQDERWIFANHAALKLLRATAPEQVLGRPALDLVHPDYRAIVRERLRHERTTGQPAPLLEQQFVALDGTVLDVEVVGIPIALEGRWGGQIIVRDIRERKRAEQALRERDELLRAVFYRTAVGIALTDVQGRFVQVNRAYQAMVGYTEDELRALTFTQITHEDDVPGNLAQLDELLAGKRDFFTFEKRYRRKDGSLMWVRNTASVIPDLAGAPRFLLGIVQDINELKRAEAEAQRSRRRLETLSQRLLEAQESERRAIARELHDQIGQALTAVKLNLQSLRGSAGGAVLPLEESVAIVEQALQAVRSLSLELRPSLLDDLGLAAALRWYADRQAQRAGFGVRVRTVLPPERLPSELETTCFRVVQEALTNVARHAGATSVQVDVRVKDGALQLTVRDDGGGFDVAAVWRGVAADGCIGLDGMEERVRLVGGAFQIESRPGSGTTVRARFPLSKGDRLVAAPVGADDE